MFLTKPDSGGGLQVFGIGSSRTKPTGGAPYNSIQAGMMRKNILSRLGPSANYPDLPSVYGRHLDDGRGRAS